MSARMAPNRNLHWIIAACAVVTVATGFALGRIDAPGWEMLWLHVGVGVATGMLSLWRLLRRVRGAQVLAPLFPKLASFVHLALTVIPLGMMASGIGMLVLTRAPVLARGNPVPDFNAVAPSVPHGIGAKLLIALVTLHILAGAFHAWSNRRAAA